MLDGELQTLGLPTTTTPTSLSRHTNTHTLGMDKTSIPVRPHDSLGAPTAPAAPPTAPSLPTHSPAPASLPAMVSALERLITPLRSQIRHCPSASLFETRLSAFERETLRQNRLTEQMLARQEAQARAIEQLRAVYDRLRELRISIDDADGDPAAAARGDQRVMRGGQVYRRGTRADYRQEAYRRAVVRAGEQEKAVRAMCRKMDACLREATTAKETYKQVCTEWNEVFPLLLKEIEERSTSDWIEILSDFEEDE